VGLDGPRNRALDRAILEERGARCEVLGLSAMSCANAAEPIEMTFGMLSRVDPRNHVLDGVQILLVKAQF